MADPGAKLVLALAEGFEQQLGLRVADSQTNFLFFECRSDSAEQAAALLRQGIIVKAWRETGYERFMRATIGSAQDNDRLLAALAVLNPR